MTLFNISDPGHGVDQQRTWSAGLANGTLKPVVGREFPLADAAKAQDAVMASGAHGKDRPRSLSRCPSMAETIDWPPAAQRRRGRLVLCCCDRVLILSAGTALSYYVEALWFSSLGYIDVFWKTLNLQSAVFLGAAVITFLALYGAFRAFKPANLGAVDPADTIIINGQPVRSCRSDPSLRLIALGAPPCFIAIVTGFGLMSEVADARAATGTAATPWRRPPSDPIFGQPIPFYLFYAAGAGSDLRLADDARRHGLRHRGLLRRRWAAASARRSNARRGRTGRDGGPLRGSVVRRQPLCCLRSPRVCSWAGYDRLVNDRDDLHGRQLHRRPHHADRPD